ncbi:MAG TPA: hypothetical protein VLH59_09010 [Ignavibacteriaceae bacterium]|nr:hypothetical protein [Ignavibacteriaceae bacterium]
MGEASIVNEEKPAGRYEVEFKAESHSGLPSVEVRNLSSGVYFYQLKAGSFFVNMQMLLIK